MRQLAWVTGWGEERTLHQDRETAASIWPAVVPQLQSQPELPSELVPGVLQCRGCASLRQGPGEISVSRLGVRGPSHLVPDLTG